MLVNVADKKDSEHAGSGNLENRMNVLDAHEGTFVDAQQVTRMQERLQFLVLQKSLEGKDLEILLSFQIQALASLVILWLERTPALGTLLSN